MTPLSRFHRLAVGHSASLQRRFSPIDLRRWQELAGANTTDAVVPEPLIAGLFSCLLGEQLPGHGTNYLKQHMQFCDLAAIDEQLTATVTVVRLRPDKALVDLDTLCTGSNNRTICTGQALVLFRR